MLNATYTREEFLAKDARFRIGAVISDGMWYHFPKWKKIARATEEEMWSWIDEHLSNGMLIQATTGAKSYRFPLSSIKQWYAERDLQLGVQLIDFLFPPRIWDGITETEGFLSAPLREIGTVTFYAENDAAEKIREVLEGVGRMREFEPGRYKVFCLDSALVKELVDPFIDEQANLERRRVSSKAVMKRRELVDFTPEFSRGLVLFYKTFGKTLVRRSMETISIYLPEQEDQEAQITMWAIEAIEKFNEELTVPFSGYLDNVIRRWPNDLPGRYLGKELSTFQRSRSRALKEITQGDERIKASVSNELLAATMGYERQHFESLEEKHRLWMASRNASSLTWAETSEEKLGINILQGGPGQEDRNQAKDVPLAAKISKAAVEAALATGLYEDAFGLIRQLDAQEVSLKSVKKLSPEYIQELALQLGIGEEQ